MTDSKRWIGEIKRVAPPELWDEVERRAQLGEPTRELSRRRPVLAAVLLLGALGVVGSTLYALRSLVTNRQTTSLAPGEIVRYRVDGAPQPLAVGEGAAWVDVTAMSLRGTGPSTIWRIDARTGEAKPLPDTTGAEWIAAGEGGVWATCNAGPCGGFGVLQLDPATGDLIRTIAVPERTNQIAVGLGSVWVSTESGVRRIDAGSGSLLATFPGNYNFLGVGGGTLWATTAKGLVQIDPSSGERLKELPFPDPCYLDVTPNTVFVATCGGATIRHDIVEAVDIGTGQVKFRVPLDGWGSMRLSGRTLIIAQRDPANQGFIRLVQLDAGTGRPTGPPFEVRTDETRFYSRALFEPNPFLAVGGGSVWLTDFGAGEVIRVGLPIMGSGIPDYPAVPTGETAQQLRTTAERIGSGNLDPDSTPPSTAQVVLSTRGAALAATSGAKDYTLDPSAPVYVVQLEGSMIGCQAKVPDASSIPTGKALYFLFDPSSGQLTDWGIRSEPIELSSLGDVSDISVKLQALPCAEPPSSG